MRSIPTLPYHQEIINKNKVGDDIQALKFSCQYNLDLLIQA